MMYFILAIVPILWLVVALAIIKMPGWKACLIAVVLTAALAMLSFGMNLSEALTASLEGALNALWPICCVIIAALFVYNLTLETKAMESIKAMLSGVSADNRVIALIIIWGFGNFMEGMAGFGTAVAIPAGILVAMGYDPLLTVMACLVVNSTPTAFGSVGVPTSTLATIAGVDAVALSGKIVIIQFLITFIAPWIILLILGKGMKAMKGMWGYCLVATLSFIIPQFIAATFIGPELPNIIGAICCMICLILYALKKGKNAEVPEEYRMTGAKPISELGLTAGSAVRAWAPFLFIFVILLFTSSLFAPIHNVLLKVSTTATFYSGENPGSLTFSWIDCPGVKIIIAGILGGLVQGASMKTIGKVFWKTLKANVTTIITICSVLAVAKIMGYSGMTSAIAATLVALTGSYYPLISPLIGMIGGFVTGSGTSTSVLFGGLQAETAATIGVSTEWLAAANMLGAGVGKMISPQGIAIGAAASGMAGQESTILTKVVKYALIYIVIGGIVCYFGLPLFT